MLLKIPVLAKSDDRSIRARQNPYCGEPAEWFKTGWFRSNGLYFTTFDFFVDWKNSSFRPVAWVKREIRSGRTVEPQEIMASILECDGKEYFEGTKNFCNANQIKLEYILIPDIPVRDWADSQNKVILFNPNSQEVSELSAKELIDLIRKYKVSSSDIKIGAEGLRYSTSSLETFLSRPNAVINYNGDAIYPGDADIVLFDSGYRPQIIIEVKKYDVGTRKSYHVSLEDESILLHLGDRYKYKSLEILQRHFDCEFYMLFYPVTEDRVVKLEKIEHLQPKTSDILSLPNIESEKSFQEFQARFLAFRNTVLANTTRSGVNFYHTNYRCKFLPSDSKKITKFASRQEAQSMGYRICSECRKKSAENRVMGKKRSDF